MSTSLVLTAIGNDRPGLVEQLAKVISDHQGNWLESSMSHLSGKFAGIVCISVPNNGIEALTAALAGIEGLRVISEISEDAGSASKARRLKLSLVGHDRIGMRTRSFPSTRPSRGQR
ncbi:glycine cleavage system protein R [Propionivibrio limicola]|uniref:glycine cleavage system protein R n=1 Tax=Propionivibrio limicola TaxID=167645 RepID=UPI001FE95EFF|nr:ACT domain-containing protein [Propionivibrio limicola]